MPGRVTQFVNLTNAARFKAIIALLSGIRWWWRDNRWDRRGGERIRTSRRATILGGNNLFIIIARVFVYTGCYSWWLLVSGADFRMIPLKLCIGLDDCVDATSIWMRKTGVGWVRARREADRTQQICKWNILYYGGARTARKVLNYFRDASSIDFG